MKRIGKSTFPALIPIAIVGGFISITLFAGGLIALSFLAVWAITHPNEFWVWIQVVKKSFPLVWEDSNQKPK